MQKPLIAIAFESVVATVHDTGVVENFSQGGGLRPHGGDPVVEYRPTEGFFWWLLRAAEHFDLLIYSTEGRAPGRFGVPLMAAFARWQESRGREPMPFPSNVQFADRLPDADLVRIAARIDRVGYRYTGDWAALNPELIARLVLADTDPRKTWDDRYPPANIEAMTRAPYPPRRPAPIVMRLLGLRSSWDGWGKTPGGRSKTEGMRMAWGELTIGGQPKLALMLGRYEDTGPHLNIAFPGVQAFINLPAWRWLIALTNRHKEADGWDRSTGYGFSVFFGSEWGGYSGELRWGHRRKHIQAPWGWAQKRGDASTLMLLTDGSWFEQRFALDQPQDEQRAPEWSARHPYAAITTAGVAQETMATVKRKQIIRIFRVFGIKVRTWTEHLIDVQFDDEMGDRRGSWKGGTIGVSYSMRPGETPFQTLRRMQTEFKFR